MLPTQSTTSSVAKCFAAPVFSMIFRVSKVNAASRWGGRMLFTMTGTTLAFTIASTQFSLDASTWMTRMAQVARLYREIFSEPLFSRCTI